MYGLHNKTQNDIEICFINVLANSFKDFSAIGVSKDDLQKDTNLFNSLIQGTDKFQWEENGTLYDLKNGMDVVFGWNSAIKKDAKGYEVVKTTYETVDSRSLCFHNLRKTEFKITEQIGTGAETEISDISSWSYKPSPSDGTTPKITRWYYKWATSAYIIGGYTYVDISSTINPDSDILNVSLYDVDRLIATQVGGGTPVPDAVIKTLTNQQLGIESDFPTKIAFPNYPLLGTKINNANMMTGKYGKYLIPPRDSKINAGFYLVVEYTSNCTGQAIVATDIALLWEK